MRALTTRRARLGRWAAWATALVCLLIAIGAHRARAKTWAPRVFRTPPAGKAGASKWVFEIHPQYRWRLVNVDPLDLNGTAVRRVFYGTQRLRLNVTMARRGIGSIFIQADLLSGVLLGDNGKYGKAPWLSSGLTIAAKQPNNAGWEVGLLPGQDPLAIESYGPVLNAVNPIDIAYAYGEVLLPFGVVRIGRQPTTEGGYVSGNDGASGRNRWGASFYHDSSDRILFGTKVSEIFRWLAEGKNYVPDRRIDRGVLLGVAYDYLVQDSIMTATDNLMMVAGQLSWRAPELDLGALHLHDFELTGTVTYRWNKEFDTGIYAIPMRLNMRWRQLSLRFDAMVVTGHTREISAGISALDSKPELDQRLLSWGAHAVLDWKIGKFTLSGEWAYASGDKDPRSTTPLTTFSWPRDTNLGLLLFEHVLAFQSARSAAIGIENLKQLDVASFPLTEVATDGRVTNTDAFFPQLFYDPLDSLRFKAGVLFAWAAQPVVDPIQTILAYDGTKIADDAVNYVGGKPGNYWGTELDLGVEWRYRHFFETVVEAAYLIPGSGLKDENGDAVDSWMIETRLTFAL